MAADGLSSSEDAPVATCAYDGVELPAYFAAPQVEYDAARRGAALFALRHRGLLLATGRDRAKWLHNLVTNVVATLDVGAGNYAFACNVQGRVLFDVNVLVRPDALWLDVDRAARPAALAHLNRYLITEDVQLRDATAEFVRAGVSGPEAGRLAAALGVPNFAALPSLANVALPDGALLVRHDFAGAPGFELFAPPTGAGGIWRALVAAGARPAGFCTLDVLRIEAGRPWWGRDMEDTVLPPETGQVERGISYHKGCYLGQEVIERMRSRAALARRLVQVRCADGTGLALPTPLRQADREVGRITSLVAHPTAGDWIGLGYLKTSAAAGAFEAGEPPRPVAAAEAP